MAKITLHERALLRTPRFPFNSTLSSRWTELKELIKDASNDFYQVIQNMTATDLLQAEEKVRFTVYKYFNRACFRATPYGGFAAVGLADINNSKNTLTISEQPVLHPFAEWSADLPEITTDTIKQQNLSLFSNSTFYRVADEIRYLRKEDGTYSISAIDFDESILILLHYCLTPVPYQELFEAFTNEVNAEDFEEFVATLIKLGLLLTSLHPNIIGVDYFKRTGNIKNNTDKQYLIAERSPITGGFNQHLFRHLPDLATRLHSLMPSNQTQDLTNFKQSFLRRFEQAEVPIMLALDPEIGVGYGEREQHSDGAILETIPGPIDEEQGHRWNELKEQLYRQMLKEPGKSIQLESLTGSAGTKTRLPNSIALACTIVDDLLYLDFAGGATATFLSGRFALPCPDIEHYCREIAAAEQEANTDVLFFDVGYTKEGRTDNINRRPSIYNLQLNILNFDTSPTPLSISDIYISVQADQVVLRSKSLNKRLLPRMATAYNYQRSELSLFRLLMDIQSQGLSTNLSIKLSELMPGLDFYPRLQFKNIIVSPAAWMLSTKLFDSNKEPAARLSMLQDFLLKTVKARYIRTGTGDQTLCLKVGNVQDTALLLDLLAKRKQLLVEEAGIPEAPAVIDEKGQGYLPQLIVTLQHSEPVAHPLTVVQERFPAIAGHEWIAPGKDWLYFEIYTHPYRSDLLLEELKTYLEQERENIVKWFFIRYNENGNHIRLRLQLRDTALGHKMIRELNELLETGLQNGLVTDLKLCTYKKEVHRYLPQHMEAVEQHFYLDSEFVISVLTAMLPDQAKYRLCMDLFDAIADSGIITSTAIEKYLHKMAEAHNQEHEMKPEQFKALNKQFKEFETSLAPPLSINCAALYERLKMSFIETISEYPELIRPKILGDLIHMHINRMFVINQRKHEMVLYNFLLLAQKARSHRATCIKENVSN